VTARGRAREEVSAGGVVFRYAAAGGGERRPVFLLIRDSYQNWGFPKGHLEAGEGPECAALREVAEETGLGELAVAGQIETIDWYFRFRGRLIHKVCHFFLMRTQRTSTCPQRSEGITACRWAPFEEAVALVSYANAREVLRRAHDMVCALDAAREVARATEVEVPVAAAVVRDADGPARRRRRTRRGRRPGPRPGNPEAGPPR
jgi:8-oxo-dGTP pyrophosphatase MutT (NUDIX family)